MSRHKFINIILGRTEEKIASACTDIRDKCQRDGDRFVLEVCSDDFRDRVDPELATLEDLARSSLPGQFADDVVLVRPGKPDRWLKTRDRDELPKAELFLVPNDSIESKIVALKLAMISGDFPVWKIGDRQQELRRWYIHNIGDEEAHRRYESVLRGYAADLRSELARLSAILDNVSEL